MGIDTMFFQELAFTVGLSLMITFLLCKFFSSVFEEDKNMSFSRQAMDDFVNKFVQIGDRVKEERGVFENFDNLMGDHEGEDEAVKVEEELTKDQENLLGCDGLKQKVVDESPVRTKFREIEVELEGSRGGDFREIGIEFGEREGVGKAANKMESEMLRESSEDNDGLFDDWEDVERTELEKSFDAAVVFVDSKANSDQIVNDVKMQLYGLHKIATDGPCSSAQPMALKLSARAKWTAWHSLGDISREEAMEQYIALLSSSITEWKNEQ